MQNKPFLPASSLGTTPTPALNSTNLCQRVPPRLCCTARSPIEVLLASALSTELFCRASAPFAMTRKRSALHSVESLYSETMPLYPKQRRRSCEVADANIPPAHTAVATSPSAALPPVSGTPLDNETSAISKRPGDASMAVPAAKRQRRRSLGARKALEDLLLLPINRLLRDLHYERLARTC